MSKVRNTSSCTVYGFMRDTMHLEGERLVAYSIIHGFTTWQGAFFPNIELICDWLGCDEGHAMSVVESLVDDEFVEVHKMGKRVAFVARLTREDF